MAGVNSMDWISINTGCFAVSNAAAKTLLALNKFVRDVRESRLELDDVATLLHSLDGTLDLLKDDASSFPPRLAFLTPRILNSCCDIINELDGCISVLGREGVPRAEKKSRWMASRDHIEKLRGTLQGYKTTLGLAVDLIVLTGPRKHDHMYSDERDVQESETEEHNELASVVSRMSNEAIQLQALSRQNGAFAPLHQYIESLQAHAVAALNLELDRIQARRTNKSSMEAPDSAIEMSYDEQDVAPPTKSTFDIPMEEIDEMLDELAEMPVRPPTPPPKSRARSMSRERRPSTSSANTQFHRPRTQSDASHRRDWSFTSNIPDTLPASTSSPPSTSSSNPPPTSTLSRRRSLSTALRSLSFRRKPSQDTTTSEPPQPEIFGTDLSTTITIARGIAGTSHSSGGSSSHSYPLSILRCVYHIRDKGLSTPDIFGLPSPPANISHLKAVFSSPVTGYGKTLSWDPFTVHDAANLILLFLSELPTPLIPLSVAKRWIVLSRQATISGSMAMRLDQGIDFWEEAFMGLKSHARALFKLLVNLWGEVADQAEVNDMTAERLAGRVMGPLLQRRYETDLVLGLAFVVRKRSEYGVGLGRGGRSNAAF
ncbi:hypothetical protein OQA88_12664 [Cercophora sp. LCS_1]